MNTATVQPIDQPDEWITEPTLRSRLIYSSTTVARLRAKGLPHVGRYRLRRYHWPTVLRWVAEHA